MSQMSHKILNILVVGDGAVGKTSLLNAYSGAPFGGLYEPTIYDKKAFEITLNGQIHTVQLHDTAGQEEFERLRRHFYKNADCFLLCYSINNVVTYENIINTWIPDLTTEHHIPIVLIGTKSDLRDNPDNAVVSTDAGEKLSLLINANAFVECSAKLSENIELAVHEAVRACSQGVPDPEP
nr:ras-like GTP-binding protein RhoL [Aedes albopictus]